MNGTDPIILKELFNCELFENLDEEEIESIAELARVENYEVGETIYGQGDRGNELYIIKGGQVSLQRCVDIGERTATALLPLCMLKEILWIPGRCWVCWASMVER